MNSAREKSYGNVDLGMKENIRVRALWMMIQLQSFCVLNSTSFQKCDTLVGCILVHQKVRP